MTATKNLEHSTLETERLLLKVIDETYAKRVLDYVTRNKEFMKEWEPIGNDDFYTLDYHDQQLKKELEHITNGSMFKVWIFKKEDKELNKIIGFISLNNIIRGGFLSCFLGYRLDKDEINKGYMTEAIEKVIQYGFNELKLHRIEANIMPKNKRSLRVVEKLGFYHEGLAKKYLKINGEWEDHIHMVMLNEAL